MPHVDIGGESIYYVQQGEHGLPVIFVHGSGGNHLAWNAQVHGLRDAARAIALDLPGHGKSGTRGRSSVAEYADVIVAFMDALGVERAMVVGHSLGGAIAQTLGLAHPDRVAALGLVGTGARLRVLPAILEGIASPTEFDKTAEFITDSTYAAPIDPEMRRRALEQFRLCSPQVTHGDFAACNVFDIIQRAAEIQAPTLIIVGREDKMTPIKYSEFLKSKIANSELVIIDQAGHSVMIEKPDEVNRALLNFIAHVK